MLWKMYAFGDAGTDLHEVDQVGHYEQMLMHIQ